MLAAAVTAAAVLLFTVVMIMLLFSIIQVVANASLFPAVRAVWLLAPSCPDCVNLAVQLQTRNPIEVC